MDKEQLDEVVMMPEADYDLLMKDLEMAARFIDHLKLKLEDLGEDPEDIEINFLQSLEDDEVIH